MRKIMVGLLLIFMMFTSGCTKGNKPIAVLDDTVNNMQEVSKDIKASIYIDGTPSMEGYTGYGEFSIYGQTLKMVEKTIYSGWPSNQIKFYKFGEKIVELGGRENLKAVLPEFYSNEDGMLETHIENVIDKADVNHLNIIVTDLFQNESDAELLIDKISNKYFKKSLSVGIFGVKSEFVGKIYDVGINKNCFSYDSGKDSKKFRPFYLLILGKPADVENYIHLLSNTEINKFDGQAFIISKYIVNPLPEFSDTFEQMSKMLEVNSLVNISGEQKYTKQFLLKGNSCGFTLNLKYNKTNYSMDLKKHELEPQIKVDKYENKKFDQSVDNQKFVSVKQSNIKDKDVKLEVAIDSSKILKDEIYKLEIILHPGLIENAKPDWISNWDMPLNKIEQWETNSTGFEGWKTLGLYKFVSGLWESNWQINRPEVAHLFCYIKKK